jgi:DNA polymerase epsilon subunit 1
LFSVQTVPSGGSSLNASDAVSSTGPERAGLDLYFLSVNGSTFKATVLYDPYFYILAIPPGRNGMNSSNLFANDEEHSVFFETIISNLMRKYESFGLKAAIVVQKQDLDAPNHLGEVGSKGRSMIKLTFDTVEQLMAVRKEIQPIVLENQRRKKEEELNPNFGFVQNGLEYGMMKDPLKYIVDMREYDVPYLVRVCIDLGIRAGAWYTVTPNELDCGVTLSEQDIETKADPSFLAFDIECTKAPLKFPDANVDSIFMISYMVEGQGYLIISRHVVSQDVQDFEYTPKPSYPGPFTIFNEQTEEDLIRRFLSEFQRLKPQIVVTYNGDFFDWPFLEQRCAVYGLDLKYELGVERVGGGEAGGEGEYRGRCCVHMDAFSWVKRDSYLPQGAQGLKAVTKYKLGYDPVEVDPEDMVQFARDRPVHMASYSVSDAVATYYLYMKYVHMFIFSLCTIIPMGPEDVLRKGSGTLCEALLMVQACEKGIICPNKEKEPLEKFHEGHLLESETYIGGKVECLETGVYRSDIEYKFDLKPSAFQMLIDNIDRDLTFAIEVEGGVDRRTITNYDEVSSTDSDHLIYRCFFLSKVK